MAREGARTLAAYHFSAKVVSRGAGQSSVAAAAYRAGEKLFDDRLGETQSYVRKSDVIEAAIFAPAHTPVWALDRSRLWNAVEAHERRKDAQVAQEYELNLPREFSDAENWRLLTDFVRNVLVTRGRVCDAAFHKPDAADGRPHPHAHILMPTRVLGPNGFGEKHPDASWKNFRTKDAGLKELRALWAEHVRTRAAELGVDLGADWDHRSFAERGVDLQGQTKRGAAAERMADQGKASDRLAEWTAQQKENGLRLLADPSMALAALTAQASTFTRHDLARYIDRHTIPEQFPIVFARALAQAVRVGKDARGKERFSTAAMIALEERMLADGAALAGRRHGARFDARAKSLDGLSAEQTAAVEHLLGSGRLAAVVGHAGSGKSTMLRAAAAQLEAQGYAVRGAALSGIAAENLEGGSGVPSRTLASWRYAWKDGRERLGARDVLIVDEAGMIGSREMAGLLEAAREAGAKLVLVGDPQQLQAIEAGAAFRALVERHGAAKLATIHRQAEAWRRDAVKEMSAGDVGAALDRLAAHGAVTEAPNSFLAQQALVERWAREWTHGSRSLLLAHTRADVRALNDKARARLETEGYLREEQEIDTSRGKRTIALGERLVFLRNDRQLGVKNGTLATVRGMNGPLLEAHTDDGRVIRVDARAYRDIDHGYALTIHKAQGVTVERAHVLATPGFDRHLALVALSRDRHGVHLAYARADFETLEQLKRVLSRDRSKDVTADYLDALAEAGQLPPSAPAPLTVEERRKMIETMAAEDRARRAARAERERGIEPG